MGVEIERKYLVDHTKWAGYPKGTGKLHRQGYMLTDPAKTIRIRVNEQEGFITIKGLSVGASRPEYEYPIPVHDAEELLAKFCPAVVSKVRYEVEVAGKLWEVDEFLDDNKGLLIAEIELGNEAESFELPEWVTTEVTDDSRYYNSNLSLHPFKSWVAKP